MSKPRFLIAITAAVAFSLLGTPSPASASSLPSGEVTFGRTVVEPAYDDSTGTLVYLSTPMGAQAHPVVGKNVAPIYLPVYPVGSGVGTLNCQDTSTTLATVENCPDHGPGVAGAAVNISVAGGFGSVYAGGVAGHDHLVGIARTGGDFNILWEPVIVLFTNSAAATHHITTLAQIDALVHSGEAIEIHNPAATFNCAVVPATVYNLGKPYQG